jgi:uncharacterized protein
MQMEPLNFSYQNLLGNKFQQLNLFLSEYSFAGLYLFRHLHHYEVFEIDGEVFIKGITRDNTSYIMLTSHPERISNRLLQEALAYAEVIFPIPEQWLTAFHHSLLQMSFKEEDSDYLYKTQRLATYTGRHLDGKRNQVKQLLTHYEVKTEKISQQMDDLQQILDHWQTEHDEDFNETDYFSCQEAIHNFHRLHLDGQVTYVDQHPSGFTIGEWLSKDCYIVHFSKALHSIRGLYQYLIQHLAQSVEGSCSWMNLEQDLGIEALRYSKLSYHPELLIKKWRIQLT